MFWLACGVVIVCGGLVALWHIVRPDGDEVTVSEAWLDEYHRHRR